MGGLPKKTHLLNELRKQNGEILAIDGGALLFKEKEIPREQELQSKTTARGIVSSYNETGFKAVGVTRHDLAAGLPFLLEIQRQSQFQWISSNLISRKSGKHYFTPQTLITTGQLTVAILGITDDGGQEPFSPADDAVILPWQEALPAQLAKVKDRADMLILLSNYPEAENRKIAALHPEIHLLLQAGVRKSNLEPTLVNNTLMAQVEPQGKYVGMLKVSWDKATKRWQSPRDEEALLQKTNELDRISWQIGRHRKKGDPLLLYKDQPANLQLYKDLLLQQKTLRNEVQQLQAEKDERERARTGFSTFSFRYSPMNSGIPDDPKVRRMVDETTKEVNSINRQAAANHAAKDRNPDAAGSSFSNYAGSSTCTPCHAEQERKWLNTRHARAYDTLQRKDQQFNTNCLPCHVTGALTLPQTSILGIGKDLHQVGCESCHGPAGQHVLSPRAHKPGQPSAPLCLNCHTPEHDGNFDFTADLARLGCGK
ncbi:UshA-like (seleno)protein [Thiovibrio sp. JS02]